MPSLLLYQAAAGATAFLITSSFLPSWEWRGVDLTATALNVSGSFLAGLAKGGASGDHTPEMRAAIAIFTSGFLAVWTRWAFIVVHAASLGPAHGESIKPGTVPTVSGVMNFDLKKNLLFTMEHAAQLAIAHSIWRGLAYLMCSLLGGVTAYMVAYRAGRRWRLSRKFLDWARRGLFALFSGVQRGAIVCAVMAMTWGGWMAGQRADRLGWGIAMAILGGVIGNCFSGLNHGTDGRIVWGNWRCNVLAYAGAVTACRYAAKSEPGAQVVMLESAFFQALVSEGFGTISGFSDLSADVGDLVLRGDYAAAAANVSLNIAIVLLALLVRMKSESTFVATHGLFDRTNDEM